MRRLLVWHEPSPTGSHWRLTARQIIHAAECIIGHSENGHLPKRRSAIIPVKSRSRHLDGKLPVADICGLALPDPP